MARVLLVDDDEDVQTVLGRYLAHDGHDVMAARTAGEALAEATEGTDVVLLDLTLPDLDGLEVMRRLRARDGDLPVLVLSARGEEADRLLGLGMGADDYVVKPFSPREVCLRVAALMRRRSAAAVTEKVSNAVLRWREVKVIPDEHQVLVRGQEVQFTPREFDLLLMFLRHPSRVLSRAAILSALWPEGYVSEHVVDVHLASLRRKLGTEIDILNVRGIGYRLAPEEAP